MLDITNVSSDSMISQYLTAGEIKSVSNKKPTLVSPKLLQVYDYICNEFGEKIKVSSAHRDWGSSASAHKTGKAFDLDLNDSDMPAFLSVLQQILPELYKLGLRGLGVYRGHIHIDVSQDNVKNVWSDGYGNKYSMRFWNYSDGLFESPLTLSSGKQDVAEADTSKFVLKPSILIIIAILAYVWYKFKKA